ncbi:aminotransferase-like domain-containing protein [Phytohalomonas tamaricis]|uniref:aminotransferase-like domain-containing protein n=1 Tax=Phytohalomonas tamaricis TaxID=2081032 RepID=UPI000D0AD58F|nr:PLP-dependent aminotransferase family protein [Phytohalomonas tamaricis]
MTIWVPTLSDEGPRYRALADAIDTAISSGRLSAGDRLPPQRRLADALGVTVGTVTRAYAEAERRGLLEARVGSGTYVRGARQDAARFSQLSDRASDDTIDLSLSLPPPSPERAAGLGRAMDAVRSDTVLLKAAIDYQPECGLAPHREVLAGWMTRLGLSVEADELIINQGGMHGIYLSLAALLAPGERFAAEALTYPGAISAAQQLGLKMTAVPFDEEGIDVAALARLHAQQPFRLVYLMPEQHNPSGAQLSEARRHALVELARARDFWLLEDGVLHLPEARRGTPLYRLAPERTIYLFSTSKILGGGLRSGVMRVPEALRTRLAAAIRAQSWMPPTLMASLVCQWIVSGDADRLLAWQSEEMNARFDLAQRWLDGFAWSGRRGGFHLWLPMPPGGRAASLIEQLGRQSVVVTSSEPFCVGSEPAPQAIRLCISAAHDRAALERALQCLREGLESPPLTTLHTL